jgi:DNA repair photolyase
MKRIVIVLMTSIVFVLFASTSTPQEPKNKTIEFLSPSPESQKTATPGIIDYETEVKLTTTPYIPGD